jgi:uncharacterized NAD(P)/FAD-binding protein YdhS
LTAENPVSCANSRYDVAIVGGGFSAVCLTVQLIEQYCGDLSIAIVSRDSRIARGIAYRTECDAHILNVPAARMSIFPDRPQHFLDWLTQRHNYEGHHFVPRRIYGNYIEHALQETLASNPNVTVDWIFGSAISININVSGATVVLDTDNSVSSAMVVLAIGNSPPMSPACFARLTERRYKSNAWANETPIQVGCSDAVLVVGTGLTAIDQILALSRDDHAGTIYVLSRRGKFPALHAPSPPWPSDWTKTLPSNIRSIVRQTRVQIELAVAAGADWRSVIDSLRHATPVIWKSLPAEEKRRFVRHVRPYWEIARHRVPVSTHTELDRLISTGRMVLLSGRIGEAVECEDCVEVTYCERDTSETRSIRVQQVINCTGPGTVSRVQDELLASLLDRELARLDPLGFGVETAEDGALLNASGEPSESIFTIGPVRKASLWESTAVPEIRVQAKELAALIGEKLKQQSVDYSAVPDPV